MELRVTSLYLTGMLHHSAVGVGACLIGFGSQGIVGSLRTIEQLHEGGYAKHSDAVKLRLRQNFLTIAGWTFVREMIVFTSKIMCGVYVDTRFELPDQMHGLLGSVLGRVFAIPVDVVCTNNALALLPDAKIPVLGFSEALRPGEWSLRLRNSRLGAVAAFTVAAAAEQQLVARALVPPVCARLPLSLEGTSTGYRVAEFAVYALDLPFLSPVDVLRKRAQIDQRPERFTERLYAGSVLGVVEAFCAIVLTHLSFKVLGGR